MNAPVASPCPPPSPRYYHALFTHSLPKALRTLADETPACVDVLMNFLVAAVTKLPPIKVPYGKRHQEARTPLVRMDGAGVVGNGKAPAGVERVPTNGLIQLLSAAGGGTERGSEGQKTRR